MKEGVIKFTLDWKKGKAMPKAVLSQAIKWRNAMHRIGMIGEYPNGIGFGNLSIRVGETFVITGSGTGGIKEIGPEHFTVVTAHDHKRNWLACEGPIQASSESLTHAAIYDTIPNANAVVHIHSKELWKRYKDKIPTTADSVPYGDPRMLKEVERLYHDTDLRFINLFVMGGHEEGMVAYARNLEEACEVILEYAKTAGLKTKI
jgi:L-ribulose-5-phosphate 4-epimerase